MKSWNLSSTLIQMEQEGLRQKDLVKFFGSKVRVSEILNKKRRLTLDMIRNINRDYEFQHRAEE